MLRERLTDEERAFAEENHNLIYEFLYRKNLDHDEYYGLVAIGYVKAVREWSRKKRLKEYNFSTIADWQMRSVMADYFRRFKSKKRTGELISLNQVITEKNEKELAEIIPDRDDHYKVIEIKLMLEAADLTERQKRILQMAYQGARQCEMAAAEGMSQANVSRELKRVKAALCI